MKIMNGQVNGIEKAQIMQWLLSGAILYVSGAFCEDASRGAARHRKEGKVMARTAALEAKEEKAMAKMRLWWQMWER